MSTILIVDDHLVNRQFLVSLLGYAGHRVLEAENGAEALEITRAEHPDLIITDILMPTMDGYEFVRQLRALADFALTPVMFYSATYREREVRSLAKAAGVQYVLSKPAEPQAILNIVNAALGLSPASAPASEILTKPLVDPVQIVSAKLTEKLGELDSLSSRLSKVIQLGLEINVERDTRRLLELFCESARPILKAKYAAVGIFGRDGKSLQHFIPSGMDPETVASLGPLPTGQGLLGVLLPGSVAIRLRDLTADLRSVGFPAGHPTMRSFLGVSISTSLQAYGQLYFTEKIGADEFSEEDERLALMLAAQLAVAYENAHLYDQIQHHAVSLKLEMTRRQRAEQDLHNSEELFRTIFEYSPVGKCIITLDGRFLNANKALCSMLGFSEVELRAKHFNDITYSEDLDIGKSAASRMLSGNLPGVSFEKRYMSKRGALIWAEVHSSLIRDSSGKPLHFITHILNVTERKQAEAALAASEKRFRALIENAPDLILVVALDGTITYSSPSLMRLLGHRTDEVQGTNAFQLVHPDDVIRVSDAFTQGAFSVGTIAAIEFRLHHRDGSWRTFDGVGTSFLNEAGQVQGVMNARDVTDRKKAEAELRESELKYRNLVETSHDLIWAIDAEGQITYLNKAAKEIYGYEPRDLIGRTFFELVDPQSSSPSNVDEFKKMTTHVDKFVDAESIVQHRDGRQITLSANSIVLRDAQNNMLGLVGSSRDITDRKKAEAARVAAEKRFRALVENAPDGIALLDINGRLQQVTPSTERMLGYTIDDAEGQDPSLLTHPDDLPALLGLLNYLLENPGDVATIQYRFRHKDGSWRWLESTISNLIAEPSVEALVFNYRDITEHRQAEEQVQRQLKNLNALRMIDIAISSSFDLSVILDVALQQILSQLRVDASAVLLFNSQGQTVEYAASRGFRSDTLPHTELKLGEVYAGPAVLDGKRIHIPDLAEIGGRLVSPLHLQQESFVEYYGAPLMVKGEVRGVLEIYHRSQLNVGAEWLQFLDALAGQAAIAIENTQLFEGLQSANAMLERRIAERTVQLQQTNAELERANRVKDEFLANMSHELRTPLNSILGMSETLLEQRRDPLSEHQQRSLQVIESSGHHLLDLINDILDLSKIEAGKFDYFPQAISVDEVCKSSLSFVKIQAVKKSIAVAYINEAATLRIFADLRRLKQILINLLMNAVKFTPEGGQVSLQVTSDLEQDLIQFSVNDTGIGIAPQDLKRLFQPFVQVDSRLTRQEEGTGLGLALVQRLTDLHGGSVQVQSEVGKGSRFTVNLRLGKSMVAQQEIIESGADLLTSQQKEISNTSSGEQLDHGTILLAEDNMANILTIGDYLERHGYQVVVAHDGLEAMEKAETIQPDLILMDIQMPGVDGLEAMHHLRANPRFIGTPIIALTALAMPGDRERCLEAGATEYMSKPVSLKTLVKTIRQLLNH